MCLPVLYLTFKWAILRYHLNNYLYGNIDRDGIIYTLPFIVARLFYDYAEWFGSHAIKKRYSLLHY